MNINCRNNISFEAKLNIKSMKTDKDRWKNIAKIFENKTSDYPNAKFGINGRPGTDLLMGVLSKDNLYNWLSGQLSAEAYKKLMTLPDIAVAEKLKAVFQFLKYKEKMIFNGEKFAEQAGFFSSKAPDKIDEQLMKLVYDMINSTKQKYLDKDSLFKNGLKLY